MDGRLLEALIEERPEGEIPERPVRNPVLYYKTRTIRSGSLTEVECYPVYVYQYRRQLRATRPTSEAVQAVNDRNARKRFQRIAECNFQVGKDYFLTLTYDGTAPEDPKRCDRELRNYLARLNRARKKLGLGKARCIGVLETGKKGRLHHHLLIEGGLDRDQMEDLWRHGVANCDRIQQTKGGMAALKCYLTKCFDTKEAKRGKGRHRYFYTRNLKQPKVTESKTRISRRQAERIREDADINAEVIFRKKWPGLVMEGIEVRQTDWLPGCYIYARMRSERTGVERHE